MECEGPVLGQKDDLVVIDCERCGYAHLRDRDSRVLNPQDDFWASPERQAFLKRETQEQDYWRLDHQARLDTFERFAGGRTLLDYGCGAGHFVEFSDKHGWWSIGYEPSATARSVKNFYNVTPVRHTSQSEGRYHALNLRLVLEHIENPAGLLLGLNNFTLESSGIICVEVPRDFSLLQFQAVEAGAEPSYWISEYHLNYFDSHSLRRLLLSCGLLAVYETTTFPMELFILHGEDYTRDPALGLRCHETRMMVEKLLTPTGRQMLLDQFSRWAWGRHVVIYARKKINGGDHL